jgi:hypothetical protein
MPSSTPNFALPYPVSTDAVNPAGDIQALATAVDTALAGSAIAHAVMLQQATTGQNVTNSLDTILTFGTGLATEVLITDAAWHSLATNPSRVTPNRAGVYRVTARGAFAFNNVNITCDTYIAKNGAFYDRSGNHKPNSTSNTALMTPELTTLVQMNGSTDYVEMGLFQSSSPSTTLVTNVTTTGISTFLVEFIGS